MYIIDTFKKYYKISNLLFDNSCIVIHYYINKYYFIMIYITLSKYGI